jgi:hypothetical protein
MVFGGGSLVMNDQRVVVVPDKSSPSISLFFLNPSQHTKYQAKGVDENRNELEEQNTRQQRSLEEREKEKGSRKRATPLTWGKGNAIKLLSLYGISPSFLPGTGEREMSEPPGLPFSSPVRCS